MKACELCNRKDVIHEEQDKVADTLNALTIEEFERVMTDMGVADHWESAFVCMDCVDYYRR